MFLKRLKIHWNQFSITRRLVFVLTTSFALLITLFSLTLTIIIRHSIFETAQMFARQEITALVTILDKSSRIIHDLSQELVWRDSDYILYYGRVLKNNKPIVSTRHFKKIFKHVKFPINQPTKTNSTLKFRYISLHKRQYLISSLIPYNHPNITIELALNTTFFNKVLSTVYQTSLWILIASLIIVIWLARYVIRGSLSPLKTLSNHFEKITASNLKLNLDEKQLPVELRELTARSKHILKGIQFELDRLISFSSELSHEIRTPVQILLGQTEIALSSNYDQDKIRNLLQQNLREYQTLQALIENMTILSRLDSGQNCLNLENFDVAEELHVILSPYQSLLQERKLCQTIHGNLNIAFDRVLFRRIMINLIDNAIKHSRPGGNIIIELKQHDDANLISVIDNGIGIPPEKIDRIFERFYRVDYHNQNSKNGLGIGLAIVEKLVKLHNSQIIVESKPGCGSTFSIVIPKSTHSRH